VRPDDPKIARVAIAFVVCVLCHILLALLQESLVGLDLTRKRFVTRFSADGWKRIKKTAGAKVRIVVGLAFAFFLLQRLLSLVSDYEPEWF